MPDEKFPDFLPADFGEKNENKESDGNKSGGNNGGKEMVFVDKEELCKLVANANQLFEDNRALVQKYQNLVEATASLVNITSEALVGRVRWQYFKNFMWMLLGALFVLIVTVLIKVL